jgi:hypothetical protein
MVLLKRSAYDLYVARHQDPNITSLLSNAQVICRQDSRCCDCVLAPHKNNNVSRAEILFLFSVMNQVALVFGGSLCFPVRF